MNLAKSQIMKLIAAYKRGENLTRIVIDWGLQVDVEVISLIYELQSGTYTADTILYPEYFDKFTDEIVVTLNEFLDESTLLLDCGTGEGTTFIPVLEKLKIRNGIGIDSSFSRLTYAQNNALAHSMNLELAVASMENLPLRSDSVDAVLTVHALEPNGGKEQVMIKELGRVTKKFIFLVEPDYVRANSIQQARMESLNYVRNLEEAIQECGFLLVKKVPIQNNFNLENCASIFVIDTVPSNGNEFLANTRRDIMWVDPVLKDDLATFESGLISEVGLWYPVIRGIPLLRESDAQLILAPSP
jgi:hypothetical protein